MTLRVDSSANTNSAATSSGAAPSPTVERFRLIGLVVLIAILVGLCILVAFPFLPSITWGIALAIIGMPFHRYVSRYFASPGLSAGITSAIVVVMIVVPGGFVAYQIAREAGVAAEKIQQETSTSQVSTQVAEVPLLGRLAAWMERLGLDIATEARKAISSYTQDLSGLAQGSLVAMIQFLMGMFILFYLFKDGDTFRQGLRDLLPLSRAESDLLFDRAAGSVHAGLYATLITSLIDGITGGIMFWLVGLPAPLLWGIAMFILSLLPIVGTGMVWVPAAAYLALSGHWLAAAALVLWGILIFIIVDTILFVRIAGERMRIHPVPALIAFLGGIAIFGLSGMILGPAILAVTEALIQVWRHRTGVRASWVSG